jgi:hypothetical protein
MFKIHARVVALAFGIAFPSVYAFTAPTVVVADNNFLSNATWSFNYTVENINPDGAGIRSLAIKEFVVPYFSDANITTIVSPIGWTPTIVNTDLFQLGNNAEILDWTTANQGIAAGSSLTGFGYLSSYAPGKGPFEVTFMTGNTFDGDPGIPLSPNAIAAGIVALPVPEPETYTLMLAGLGLIGVAIRRRQK